MKDGKANITLDNVYCKEAFSGVNPIDTIPIYDEYPEKKGKSKTGLKKEKYVELMVLLRTDLERIVSSYKAELLKKEEEW